MRLHLIGSSLIGAVLLCALPAEAQSIAADAASARAAGGQARMHRAAAAARTALAAFVRHALENGTQGVPSQVPFDVTDLQDLGQATIGQGFQMHTVDPAEVIAGRSDISGMVRPTGEWRFVVQAKGKPVGLVTMREAGGTWEAVSFGGAGLAREMDGLMARHGNADRSNLRFVRVYQAQSDLLEVTSEKDAGRRFVLLHSAQRALALPQSAAAGEVLHDSSELLDPLRNAIRQNLAATR